MKKYYLIPIRMATIKKTEKITVGKNTEKFKPFCTVGRNVKFCSH